MNYYQHHIGDFNNATRHLTRLERSIYRDLIDLYYDKELPLVNDIARLCKLIILNQKSEKKALETVLNDFFTLEADGWHNKRCDDELKAYQEKSNRNREIGKLGGRPKKTEKVNLENPEITQTVNFGNPEITLTKNQEPLTKNQEPLTSINYKYEQNDFWFFESAWKIGVSTSQIPMGPFYAIERNLNLAATRLGLDVVLKALENYNAVISSADYYFKHQWNASAFLEKGVDNFTDAMKPLENYKIKLKSNDPKSVKEHNEEVSRRVAEKIKAQQREKEGTL